MKQECKDCNKSLEDCTCLEDTIDMKQSAVEWLCEQYHLKQDIEIVNQAKEIEKQQQGFSEEEVIELLQKALTHKDDGEIGSLVTAQGEIRTANFFSWFEQFKNK